MYLCTDTEVGFSGSLQFKRGAFFSQRLTHRVRSVFQVVPTALLSSSLLPPFVCERRSMSQAGLLARFADVPPDLSPLFFLWRKWHPGSYYSSWAGATLPCSLDGTVWPITAAKRKREDFQSSAHIHIPVFAKYLFHRSLKITNKGKSFYYSSLSEGRLKKGWMTLVRVLSAL